MKYLTWMLCIAYSFSSYAQTDTTFKFPINISRVLINIKEAAPLCPRVYKSFSGISPIKIDTTEVNLYYYDDEFRSNFSFYEEPIKRVIEKAFVERRFDIRGWENIFPELSETQQELLSVAFIVKSFKFKYNYTSANVITPFASQFVIQLKVLDKRRNLVVLDKEFTSDFYSSYFGILLYKPFGIKYFFEKALDQLVGEIVVDADFKKVLADAQSNGNISASYEKLTLAKVPPKADKTAAIASALDASVTIMTGATIGSGVLVSKDGLILTCSHTLGGNTSVDVVLSNKVQLKAKVLRNNPEFDVALLQLESAKANPLPLGSIEKSAIGEDVWVVGTPKSLELGQSVSKGIVSGKRVINGKSYIQMDASVSPGNSGGPLVNPKGEVIGIVNAKIVSTGTEGVGFAIPIDVVLDKLSLDIIQP